MYYVYCSVFSLIEVPWAKAQHRLCCPRVDADPRASPSGHPPCNINDIALPLMYIYRKRQNLRVGGYTENLLKWFTYPQVRAHPGCEVSCHGTEWTCIVCWPWFVEASPTVEKAASCYKVNRLVASLLSFRSVQSSLAVREFRAAWEERCKRGHGWVCAKLRCLMSCRPMCIRT